MTLFGDGEIALVDDPTTADRLGWRARRRSAAEPLLRLRPRSGDPRREPWIAPPWWRPGVGHRAAARRRDWSYLPEPAGVLAYLEAMARRGKRRASRVALAGLGRVGGIAATVLSCTPTALSGVRELLVYDVDGANQERWLHELGAVGQWRADRDLPRVRPTTIAQVFSECDVFLFAATTAVPPLGSDVDVRFVQFEPNRALLRGFLEQARAANFTGLFLVVSDPVDWLAQAAFHDSNSDALGRFVGAGLAPERVGGLGLGVMWGRALAAARREGWGELVARRGGAFGPHSNEVTVFDDLATPNAERSACLSWAAREGNLVIRHLGYLPFVGPGVSSVGLTLPALLAGRSVLASVLTDGIFFGCEARPDWGLYPASQRLGVAARDAVLALHARQVKRAESLSLLWDEAHLSRD
jgi:hypothetical protein